MESFYSSALFNCANLKLVTNRRMMAVGLALIVVGILIYVALFSATFTGRWLQMLSIVVCVSAVFVGISILINYRKKLIYTPTGSIVRRYQFYYDRCELDRLAVLLTSPEELSDSFCLNPRREGDVRLDVLLSDDGQFAVAQAYLMSDYVYYTYSRLIAYGADYTPRVVSYFRSCIDKQ